MMTQEEWDAFSGRVLSDMGTAVLVMDLKGTVVYANHPAEEILELKTEPGSRNSFLCIRKMRAMTISTKR